MGTPFPNKNIMRICDLAMQAEALHLRSLQHKLKRIRLARLATQRDIEQATGVDQTTVSRAAAGMLRRKTSSTIRIEQYASMLLAGPGLPDTVEKAALGFLSMGGTEVELLETLRLATELVRHRTS
jgi:transcriptional regulator with XRE-family HTH domain